MTHNSPWVQHYYYLYLTDRETESQRCWKAYSNNPNRNLGCPRVWKGQPEASQSKVHLEALTVRKKVQAGSSGMFSTLTGKRGTEAHTGQGQSIVRGEELSRFSGRGGRGGIRQPLRIPDGMQRGEKINTSRWHQRKSQDQEDFSSTQV